MHWYDDLPHVGYDMDGKRVLKPARGDELDRFLKTVEDPNSWLVLDLMLICARTSKGSPGPLHSTKRLRPTNLSQLRSLTLSADYMRTKIPMLIMTRTNH